MAFKTLCAAAGEVFEYSMSGGQKFLQFPQRGPVKLLKVSDVCLEIYGDFQTQLLYIF